MISIAKTAKIFVGVDVSKATLDVYRPAASDGRNGRYWRICVLAAEVLSKSQA